MKHVDLILCTTDPKVSLIVGGESFEVPDTIGLLSDLLNDIGLNSCIDTLWHAFTSEDGFSYWDEETGLLVYPTKAASFTTHWR